MRHALLLPFLLLLMPGSAPAHPTLAESRVISFPDIEGALTLVCDLHTHTAFSDGWVWPPIRVEEAKKDGLDCLALTEHLEYQPHAADIPHKDRDRAYALALEAAEGSDLIVVQGSEITREMPPGHANAVFITDSNKLLKKKKDRAVFQEANDQGGFVFWNHPHWSAQRPDGVAKLDPIHEELIRDGLIHGIEVVNDVTYSDEALQIALDHNLTILATSDIHDLIDWRYDVPGGGHRPVTLVFAAERTAESIKEALVARRTVAWFNNTLIGRAKDLAPLLTASLVVTGAEYERRSTILAVTIENRSDVEFLLRSTGKLRFHGDADVVSVPPGERTLRVKTLEKVTELTLPFEVLNAVTAPGTHADLEMKVTVTEADGD
jgi:hypothetical protein